MSLAIVKAAAYITRRSRFSVSQYLEKTQKNHREVIRLLNHEGRLHRDWEAKNSILPTWQIFFDHIQEVQPSAADLLSMLSIFDRQGIPGSMFRIKQSQINNNNSSTGSIDDSPSEDGENSVSSTNQDQSLEDDITTLCDYSLVSVGQKSTIVMHRLVQLTVHTWLKLNHRLDHWKTIFIVNLWREFPTAEYKN